MSAFRQFLHGWLHWTHLTITARRYGRVTFRGCTCGKVFEGQHGPESVVALLREMGFGSADEGEP